MAENRLKLSPRLMAIAKQVREGTIAADIGTDHGYLACYLAQKNCCKKVYASDLNPGPLKQAQLTVQACGLENRIITMLSDGVSKLPLEEISDVVVAGMGGDLILSIITDKRLCNPEKRLILQPMTKAEILRRGLFRLGFELIQETAVCDGRFVYTILVVQYTGIIREIDDFFALTGLLSGKTAEESVYLNRLLMQTEKKLAGIRRSGGETYKLEELVLKIRERVLHGESERNF